MPEICQHVTENDRAGGVYCGDRWRTSAFRSWQSASDSRRAPPATFRARIVALVAVWLAGAGLAWAEDLLCPWQNFHPPIPIQSFYWYRCPYGLLGPHDRPGQPANGVGPPPLILPPCCGYHPITGEPILYSWHQYARSPRDFFMLPPVR